MEEEADESIYRLELIEAAQLANLGTVTVLKKEADELTAIFTAIGKTTHLNQQNLKNSKSAEIRNRKSKIRNV